MKKWLILAAVCLASNTGFAQVKLPALIRDSMILQRDVPVNIWGWAGARETVTVSFKGKTYKAIANKQGDWSLKLQATKAGGPYNITISSKNTIVLREVLFGDVFFCSGQSNMVHQLNIHDITYANEIATANYPQIRQFWVPNTSNLSAPQNDLPTGRWAPAVGEQVRPFSAVAYFFAKQLHEKYKVPIGIINASVGGTPIQAWTSEQGLKDFATIQQTIAKNKDSAYVNDINRTAAASSIAPVLKDAGMEQPLKWYDSEYKPSGWRNINIPGYWEDQGIKDLNGIVWYRKEMELPATMDGKAAKVFLGRIVDADELYINGKKIGNTTYLYPQRRYAVPANVLRSGKNLFVIRVTNYNGKGGFVPDKPYSIFAGSDTVDLKGTWQYKVGAVLAPAN
ncbi:MAG: sialate O-acetylesterase, partial [Chitinophagaceae bacterium]